MAFIVFFSIVMLIYGAVNYYVYTRGLQAIPAGSAIRPIYPWIFWTLAASYVVGRIMENLYLSYLSDVLVWTGSFWLAALLYFFLAVVMLDLIRLVNHVFPFFPSFIASNMEKSRLVALTITLTTTTLIIVFGAINARNPVVRTVDINIEKQSPGGPSQLRAVMLSDIHLGTIIANGHLQRIIEKVNKLEPGVILIAGDILDEDLAPVIRQNTGKILRQLSAPLGVYGIMGNHEHIGGAEAAFQYLESNGIRMLRDSVVKVGELFYLVGREDRDKERFSGKKRLPLSRLMEQVDPSYPVILLDHQPFYLEKAAQLGIDLQLSGHTHHGQIWPLNYITQAMYAISHGYGKIDGMHTYVSNGVGTWGPPVRVGNRPEIVLINLVFE